MKIRFYILLQILFASQLVYGQIKKHVNAIVEDSKFLYTLETIDMYPDSTVLSWKSMSKFRNATFKYPKLISLKDLHSGTTYNQLCTSNKTIAKSINFKKPYDIRRFKTCFPTINDSTEILIQISNLVYIDSLNLSSNNLFFEYHKYRIPLYNHQPLLKRADSINYSTEMYYNGIKLFNRKKYQQAVISFENSLAIERQLRTFQEYLNLYNDFNEEMWIANCYYKLGELKEAENYSSTYYVEPYDKKLRKRANSLEMSLPLHDEEKLEVLKEICKLDSINIGGNSFRFAESLYKLAVQYFDMHDYKRSEVIFEQAKRIIIDNYNDNNWLISSIYKQLASISNINNDIVSAIRYMKRGLLIKGDTVIIDENDVVLSDFVTLSYYYKKAGDWDKGIQIMNIREQYWRNLYEKEPQKIIAPLGPWSSWYDNQHAYSETLSDYASFLNSAGLFKQELRKYKESLNVKKKKYGWAEYRSLGYYYYSLRDYNKALSCYDLAAKDFLKSPSTPPVINENEETYLNILNALASSYAKKGDFENAIAIQKIIKNKALGEIQRKDSMLGKWKAGYDTYADYISNLSRFYILNQQYDSAMIYEKENLEIKRTFSPNCYNLAYSYLNLGSAYLGKEMWNEAIAYLLQAYNIYNQYEDSEDRSFFLRTLLYLSKCYYKTNSYNDLKDIIPQIMSVSSNDLFISFQELTYNERSRYIEEYSDILNQQIPTYAYYTHSDSIIEAAFNASLMMKGALLNSENSVKRIVEESNDDSLIDLWDEMRADRYILSKELEKDSLNRKLNVDSLQKVIYNLEDSLILKCKEYGDITRSMSLKWNDIQQQLHSDDLAIEFLSFPINKDSVMYVALSLRKHSKCPKMTTLFEGKQLKGFPDSLHYQCKEMTDLVWKPLQSELEGVKNIYFSPSGALYNIGIEYLPEMEDYKIYRLSSTRELVTGGKTETKNRAVLYGGLRYDAGFDKSTTEKSLAILDETFKERANVRGLGLRGGKEYLKHTKEEVDIIGEELSKVNWECVIDSAAMGTEESFKALSGRKIGCLHISTHGFYYTKEDADNARYKFMLIDNDMVSAEDKALTRSGLVMSGANHILEDEELPDNVEDGILTAREIADVDLRGLDLVVLSACQTGLGDISQGEGVFGLQRGFKKAGASSILMSLWEVDDKATQILMTQFYKNLLYGQSKRQALLSAQKHLREIEGGKYDKPRYWAAFILLDGLDKSQMN